MGTQSQPASPPPNSQPNFLPLPLCVSKRFFSPRSSDEAWEMETDKFQFEGLGEFPKLLSRLTWEGAEGAGGTSLLPIHRAPQSPTGPLRPSPWPGRAGEEKHTHTPPPHTHTSCHPPPGHPTTQSFPQLFNSP